MRRGPLPTAIVAGATALLAVYLLAWLQVTPARERGSDFSASYVAALLVREGRGGDIYDQGVEAARHAQILEPGTHADLPFITPPATALLTVPLTFLDPGSAFRVFSLVQFVLLAAATWVAARAAPWPRGSHRAELAAGLAALAGAATLPFLLLGQWDGVCALGLALAYAAWRHGRPFSAGICLAVGLGLAKPHLGLGLAAFVIGGRDLRALAGALLGSIVVAGGSIAGVGASASAGFFGAASLALGHTPAPSTMGLLGLASSWLGDGTAARVFAVAGGGAGVVAAGVLGWRARQHPERLEGALATATGLSLVIAPHLLAHDVVLLAPALMWMSARAAAVDAPRPWPGPLTRIVLVLWVVLAAAVSLDAGNGAPAPPGRVVPWGLLGFALIGLTVVRRSGGAARAR